MKNPPLPRSRPARPAVAVVHDSARDAELLHVFGDLAMQRAGEFETAMVSSVRIGRRLVVDLSECRGIAPEQITALTRARSALGARISIRAVKESEIAARLADAPGAPSVTLVSEATR